MSGQIRKIQGVVLVEIAVLVGVGERIDDGRAPAAGRRIQLVGLQEQGIGLVSLAGGAENQTTKPRAGRGYAVTGRRRNLVSERRSRRVGPIRGPEERTVGQSIAEQKDKSVAAVDIRI